MVIFAALPSDDASAGATSESIATSMAPERHVIAGREIDLFLSPFVFKPTLTTSVLTEQVLNSGVNGQSVLDLGCGSGPIAIALAQAGAGSVHATDLMQEACTLARRNTILNRVQKSITILQGNLFEPVDDLKFDVIVDDVSGVANEVARLSSWFPPDVPLAGPDGTNLAIEVLKRASSHLKPGGRLFFPVLSLSNAERIVAVAQEQFPGRLTKVTSRRVPFNPELKDHLDVLLTLRSRGVIGFEQIRSRLFWILDIYRADADR